MGVTADGIVEHAVWVPNARNAGSSYDPEGEGYPFRVVFHTIEGSLNGPGMISGHQYPPHLWYNPQSRALYQTIPLTRGAFALYQAPDAPYYTNRARALQVEISGFAAEAASWPTQWLDNLAVDVLVPLCQFVAAQGGQIDLLDVPDPGPIPNSARADAPQRMDPRRWAFGFKGVCSHRHVPMGDDHWDTGGMNTKRAAEHAALIVGGLLTNPSTPEDTGKMAWLFSLRTDPNVAATTYATDGVTAVQLDGGTFTTLGKLGAVPPGFGPIVSLAEVGQLLAYDPQAGTMRPLREVIAGSPAPQRPALLDQAIVGAIAQQVAARIPAPGPGTVNIDPKLVTQALTSISVTELAKAIVREFAAKSAA